jgi:hypothetical protein
MNFPWCIPCCITGIRTDKFASVEANNLPAHITSRSFGRHRYGSFGSALHNFLIKDMCTDGGKRGYTTFHVVSVMVRPIMAPYITAG